MSKCCLLLLLFCVHLVTSAVIPAKRATVAEKEEILKEINKNRVKIAENGGIGNMHELVYDFELEKVANSMGADCNFPPGDYTLVSTGQIDPFDTKATGAFIHPLQTKIACVGLAAPCLSRGIDEKGFCLLGPQTSPPNPDDFKRGPLGSHCDHGVADNGLCKAVFLRAEKPKKKYEEFVMTTETPVVHYEKQNPVEDNGGETKAATQMNSMILAVVFVIVMVFP
ncbi:unnamed protein product [Caenorhabditis brenneri]